MATYFSTTPVLGCAQNEANFHLYIHQFAGQNANQTIIVDPPNPNQFAEMAISNWAVREGKDPGSKLIAHAQGLHVQCDQNTRRWYVSFNMLFEDDSLKGSTLKVLGDWVESASTPINWAVVGGTGQFTLAQGIISGTNINDDLPANNHRVMEIFIRILYRPFEIPKMD